jgi:hypothetical protein
MVGQPDSPKLPTPAQPIDEALRDACAQIYERLGRVEAALQRTEGIVADKPWDFAPIAFKRLDRVEDMLRSLQRSLDDSTLQEMCVNLERQIVQTRMVVQRTETAVSGDSLREFCADIDARLMRTEDTIRRTETIVSGWRKELSPPMARVVDAAADARPRIEDGGQTTWPPAVAMPALVVGMTIIIGALIWTVGNTAPTVAASRERPSVPAPVQATTMATAVPVVPPLTESPAPMTAKMPPVRPTSAPAPRLVATQRVEVPPRPQFVGTLSITSVPSGAAVSINGNPAGVTPLRLPRQRAGSMAVQIARDGFERWSSSVRVPADQLTQVTATLRPIVQ